MPETPTLHQTAMEKAYLLVFKDDRAGVVVETETTIKSIVITDVPSCMATFQEGEYAGSLYDLQEFPAKQVKELIEQAKEDGFGTILVTMKDGNIVVGQVAKTTSFTMSKA